MIQTVQRLRSIGNDVFDISVIVGAGGNMTIQQVGDPSTRKGDPVFMQGLRREWKKADAKTKQELAGVVHLDKAGVPVRIDAPKSNQHLEAFVRRFAENKVYIGVGAWAGSKGDPGDNAQVQSPSCESLVRSSLLISHTKSSAAHGDKDLLITYAGPDQDASPDPAPHLEHRPQAKIVEHVTANAAAKSNGEAQRGPGIVLTNHGKREEKFFFYNNYWNGNGTAGANFDHPQTSLALRPGQTHFVALSAAFKGRVQRGTLQPSTWAEFQLSAANDRAAHGDISLEQGCDGAAMIEANDGSRAKGGFEKDILAGAPHDAVTTRADGRRVLASTMGNWMAPANHAAAEYELKVVGQRNAYIVGGMGTPDVASRNQCLAVNFY